MRAGDDERKINYEWPYYLLFELIVYYYYFVSSCSLNLVNFNVGRDGCGRRPLSAGKAGGWDFSKDGGVSKKGGIILKGGGGIRPLCTLRVFFFFKKHTFKKHEAQNGKKLRNT